MAQDIDDYEDPLQEFLKNHPDDDQPAQEQPAQEQPAPAPEPAPEVEEGAKGDRTEVEPPPEDAPAPEGDGHAGEEWKKSEVFSDMDKMSHGFRKRIEKLNQKHATEMEELKSSYEARLKALEERTAPKPEVKGREAFTKDEDYMAYLVREELEKDRAERAAAEKAESEKAAEKAAAEKAEKDKADAELARRQEVFRRNTENSFDTEGKARFTSQLMYAMEHGFGDVLDNNPAASDYLLGNRMGPRVMDRLLNNPQEFRDVFMAEGQSQMDQYYTLKQIEAAVLAEGRGETAPAPGQQMGRSQVRLGKPGGQGSQARGATVDDDPQAREEYLHKLGIC